jgi:signal transduction histidine kinase
MDQPMRFAPAGSAAAPDHAALFEHLSDPYVVLDSELAIVATNAAWRALFAVAHATDTEGANAQAARTSGVPESRAPLRHEQLIRTLAGTMRSNRKRLSPVFRMDVFEASAHASARPRYWQMHASFIPATSSAPALIALRVDDVTARNLAVDDERREKARFRSHARLRQILHRETEERLDDRVSHFEQACAFAGLGTWQIDAATGAFECSEQCLQDLNAGEPGDLVKEQLLGDSTEHVSAHWAALESGQAFEFERCVTPSDAYRSGQRWVLVRGMGRFNADGTLRYVMGFTLNITSRKQHELQLGALADAERAARERSEALARTMDQFIAAVSHELRSPLNAIVSWAELLGLVADPAHASRAGEAIRRNGRQLSLMVDDLLDSGAIATGKLSVNLQPVDLGVLAAVIVQDMRKPAEHKGIELRASAISPCIVMADESRMKQVVWNILTNAVKFTDSGSVEVSVSEADGYAQMSVRDTGRGIAADALPLVFERFQQIAPRESGRVGGLGLGLWLARHIVGLHGGTIAVASDGPDRGACFTVRLPLASGSGDRDGAVD